MIGPGYLGCFPANVEADNRIFLTAESRTMSSFPYQTLVLATHNKGKVSEINDLLAPLGVTAIPVTQFSADVPEETETTFAGNALIKARAACAVSGLPALSDDSGLEVMALDRAPGVYSADWAELPDGTRDFSMAMGKVLARLAGKPDRRARFVCTLALVTPEGFERVFEGQVIGAIADAPSGTKGFGYDPIFVPDGSDLTYGETDPAIKHATSHRADAFAQLLAALSA
jgi:XTP/dITP diphosphohydrolase